MHQLVCQKREVSIELRSEGQTPACNREPFRPYTLDSAHNLRLYRQAECARALAKPKDFIGLRSMTLAKFRRPTMKVFLDSVIIRGVGALDINPIR